MTILAMVYVDVVLMSLVVFVRMLLMVTGRIRLMLGWFEVLVIGLIVLMSGFVYVWMGHGWLEGLFVVMIGGLIGLMLCMVSDYLRG